MVVLAGAMLVGAGAAVAQPVDAAGPDELAGGRLDLRGPDPVWLDGGGLNAFFYPSGYDPQYGSEGKVGDAGEFAASYGCRPIWNAKTGRTTASCH